MIDFLNSGTIRKNVLMVLIIICVLVMLLVGVVQYMKNCQGISNVIIVEDEFGNKNLEIDYFDMTGYSVTMCDKVFDIESCQWKNIDNYETLGEYCFVVKVVDTKIADTLSQKYSANTVHVLEKVPSASEGKYKILIVYPPDDSLIYIIIGSDIPIVIEEQEFKRVSAIGKIRIPFE